MKAIESLGKELRDAGERVDRQTRDRSKQTRPFREITRLWRLLAPRGGTHVDALRAAFPALEPLARQVLVEDDRRDRDKQADTTEHRNGCDRLKVGDRPNRCF